METVIHHRREFVLYSLRNIEPMKVDMHNLGQSAIKLLRTTEKTCCSIQKTLKLDSCSLFIVTQVIIYPLTSCLFVLKNSVKLMC